MEFHPLAQHAQAQAQINQHQAPAAAEKKAAVVSDSMRSNSPTALAEEQAAHFRHPGVPNRSALPLPSLLSPEQLASYDRDGFLLIKAKDVWSPSEMKLLLAAVNLMDDWPDKAGEYMKYYEKNRRADAAAGSKVLSRIENFTQYNPGLDFLLTGDKLPAMCSDLFGEPSIMYKEKVNYKMPGSDGFAPHQDVAAGWWLYKQSLHVSCLVSIDPATLENGCLEVAAGEHKRGMLSAEWKEIPEDTVARLRWQHVPTEPGDVLFFDSYVPHRSAPNTTDKPRRVLYATYAKASEGDWRARYYADKRAAFPPDIERAPGTNYEYKI
jgi:ectoine hydroxylase-related dioxygenase (phytanoyl-CoA dioxygenase family)